MGQSQASNTPCVRANSVAYTPLSFSGDHSSMQQAVTGLRLFRWKLQHLAVLSAAFREHDYSHFLCRTLPSALASTESARQNSQHAVGSISSLQNATVSEVAVVQDVECRRIRYTATRQTNRILDTSTKPDISSSQPRALTASASHSHTTPCVAHRSRISPIGAL